MIKHKVFIRIRRLILKIVLILYAFIFYLFAAPIYTEASTFSHTRSNSQELEDEVLKIIRAHPEVILEAVESYRLKQIEQKQEAKEKLLQEFQERSNEIISQSPVYGSVGAEVFLIEFSDFQCPYCAEIYNALHQFADDHKDKVALVYKHYPITQIHPQAISAATASWAANQQGRFWQYHDFLFAHQDQLGEDLYLQAATDLGLDLSRFEHDRKSQDAITAIREDMDLAERLGISGTPFFVMGEETFSGAVQRSFLEDKLADRTPPT